MGSTAWKVLASSSSDTMELEPQDRIPESCGLYLELSRRPRTNGWQLEDALCPQDLQKRVTGYSWVRGTIWRVHESLLGVVDLHVKRLGQMETGRGSGGE